MEKRAKKTTKQLIKVAITGPESTGKSMLAEQLAAYYHTVFAPEYARNYIDRINREYTFEDLAIIAKGQIAAERDAEKNADKILFCDTELTVIKIWSEHKYNMCPEWVAANLTKFTYDLYLLCDIDLDWKYDPLREHPHLRSYFFDWYYKELKDRNVPFKVVKGKGAERLKNALFFTEELLSK
ncbi:MAG TPA: ATP-binding protein [Bacteroidales bacterium]|nr:ATP-binding protein [Bacteroidales bacterium]HOH83684.1 ATP-binding protein [Bacteroidales bacterium]HPB24131.1 ATP-binding protein [Bacteroidales bacterium]HPI29539.1 ATP-binding protein [Bacteroidales bacterium]HQN14728.1 ATP-binding protein [Bacteroidales bacterium]